MFNNTQSIIRALSALHRKIDDEERSLKPDTTKLMKLHRTRAALAERLQTMVRSRRRRVVYVRKPSLAA
jgi:hypothetical protein